MTGERDWPTGFRAVLADRGPRALLASHGLSGIGQTLGTVATSVALFEATHSTTWVSVGAAARLLPYMLFSALAGVVADRLDRRRLLLASHVARALLTAALLVVVAFDGSPCSSCCCRSSPVPRERSATRRWPRRCRARSSRASCRRPTRC